jgi:outer membrane putative beta-barrel porin/alpha-amylase
MKKKTPVAIIIFAFAFTRFNQTVPANAQYSASGSLGETVPPGAVSANRQQKDDFIVPSRPTVSGPADIQRVGVLQLEFGLDAEFDAKEFRNQQTTPLDLRFAALSRLLLEFQLEIVKSQVDRTDERVTGVGDAIIGLQVVAFKRAGDPTFSFAYNSKLPTASKEKNLGSGRADHKAVLLISDQVGDFDLAINAAYLNVARKDSGRRADGGLFSIALSYKFENHFGLVGELSGQSLEFTLPRGIYQFGGVTYQVNRRLRFDAGVRFGVGAEAPRVSVVAGFVVGIADLY